MKKFSYLMSMGMLLVVFLFNACSEQSNNVVENESQLDQLLKSGSSAVHWGYSEENGPDLWADLDEHYALCGEGVAQSPINIVESAMVEDDDLPSLEFDYNKSDIEVHNNGHTVQANVPVESNFTLTISGNTYKLLQFHFHTTSENLVEGHEFPMEMHLVHQKADGSLAVAGVFLVEGNNNDELNSIFASLPQHEGDHYDVQEFDLNKLLPGDLASFRFAGSLTTPPCSEGVAWNVLVEPLELSNTQINNFKALFYGGEEFPHGNRRPVLPLNGRLIYTDADID